jgi:metallophosphoesterase (TIGR00282 family)
MRLIFLGDVVGRPGRRAVREHLPGLRERYAPDLVVINGENAAGGFGITEAVFNELREAGCDVITLGNHAWDQKEALDFISTQPTLLRPINFPRNTPGRSHGIFKTASGKRVQVINAMGRIFMDPLDDPFAMVERQVTTCALGVDCDATIVDFHAEATSEKQAMGYYLDGRVSLVVGTHTHVPTCDHRVLPGGTAYVSDAGMCGDYESILGMDREEPVSRFVRRINSTRMQPAQGEGTVSGVAIEIDDATGHGKDIGLIRIGGCLKPEMPAFW